LAQTQDNKKAQVLADALDEANAKFLATINLLQEK
jgi:isocitrate dehydrogenase